MTFLAAAHKIEQNNSHFRNLLRWLQEWDRQKTIQENIASLKMGQGKARNMARLYGLSYKKVRQRGRPLQQTPAERTQIALHLRQQHFSYAAIARLFGCSRQNVESLIDGYEK